MNWNLDKISYLTQDELKRLFSAIKGVRDRALFLTAYRHGLRASEVGLLLVSDVDFAAGRLSVRRIKGSNPGVHLIERDEARRLRAWLKVNPEPSILFPSNRGVPISRRTLDFLMKQYGAAANLPPSKRHFHCLKHTCGTHLLEAGRGVEWVQDWLGHKDIKNTLVYSRITNKSRDEGAREAWSRLPRF